jgi:hypothetical protein
MPIALRFAVLAVICYASSLTPLLLPLGSMSTTSAAITGATTSILTIASLTFALRRFIFR